MRTLSVWLMLLCVGLFVLGCQPADTSSPAPSIPQSVAGDEDMGEEAAEGEEAPAEGEEAAEEAPAEGEEAPAEGEEAPAEGEKAPEGEAPAEKPAE